MNDVLPEEAALMTGVEQAAREVYLRLGYGEIRTPHLELTEVFTRSIGEDTDIVEKEMYSFTDRGGKHVSLRPEGTAPVVRAFIQNIWRNTPEVSKLFYSGAMFRGERPQKGRQREFRQIGAEIIGGSSPLMDAELIFTLHLILRKLEISGHKFIINSLGCSGDREKYKEDLGTFIRDRRDALCENCQRRAGSNVLRVLDCKSRSCRKALKGAPEVNASLCESCLDHYEEVKRLLGRLGVDFEEKAALVRGLDYYTGVVFEAEHEKLGAQSAFAAGGRYDGLSALMGGPEVGACGYAIGLERLIMLLKDKSRSQRTPGALIVPRTRELINKAFMLASSLWQKGLSCQVDHSGLSFKGQLRRANRESRRYVVIISEEEFAEGKVILKDMELKEQSVVPAGELAELLAR